MLKNVERILVSTRKKTDDLSSRVEALVQKQANLQGVQEWLGNLGRHPYAPSEATLMDGALPTRLRTTREASS